MKTAALLLSVCVVLLGSAAAGFADWPSAHQMFLEAHRDAAPSFETVAPRVALPDALPKAYAEKFGFYPYWVTQPADDLPWGFLTTVAFFSLEINQYGQITNLHGWPDGELVDAAHAHGRRAVLTITNFSSSQLATLLASATYRATAIDHIVDQVVLGGADGVSIDFENLPYSAKTNFLTFLTALKAALEGVIDNPHLTVCTPAIDWDGAFDYDQIAARVDYLFIMAYNYHYAGGDPGPVAPLYAGGIWPTWCGIDYTLDDYETYLAPYTLQKVILGLPLYGYDWPTTSSAVPGDARGTGESVTTGEALDMVSSGLYGPRRFDDYSDSPYLAYNGDDGWHQVWYTDWRLVLSRFNYGQSRGVAGIGFWALGYTAADVFAAAR